MTSKYKNNKNLDNFKISFNNTKTKTPQMYFKMLFSK